MSNKIQGIAELICMANGNRYEKLNTSEQQRITTYAESIMAYITNKS